VSKLWLKQIAKKNFIFPVAHVYFLFFFSRWDEMSGTKSDAMATHQGGDKIRGNFSPIS
jgi:hypothetical protein